MDRVCPQTGLKLVPASWQVAYRIQGSAHPAISAASRDGAGGRKPWNRYDTPGTTVYLADNAVCAYQETIAQFKRKLGSVDPLQKDANALGMTLDEFYAEVAHQWEERQFMYTGTLPRQWREKRLLHVVSLAQHGWWVDIEDTESLSSLEKAIPDIISSLGIHSLDRSEVLSLNRALTTRLAEHVRGLTLFDGSKALGIVFGSRHGGGTNFASWLRAHDDGRTGDPEGMEVLTSSEISFRDTSLEVAARLFDIRIY